MPPWHPDTSLRLPLAHLTNRPSLSLAHLVPVLFLPLPRQPQCVPRPFHLIGLVGESDPSTGLTQDLVQKLSYLTDLKPEFAMQCLERNGWDYNKALSNFYELKVTPPNYRFAVIRTPTMLATNRARACFRQKPSSKRQLICEPGAVLFCLSFLSLPRFLTLLSYATLREDVGSSCGSLNNVHTAAHRHPSPVGFIIPPPPPSVPTPFAVQPVLW